MRGRRAREAGGRSGVRGRSGFKLTMRSPPPGDDPFAFEDILSLSPRSPGPAILLFANVAFRGGEPASRGRAGEVGASGASPWELAMAVRPCGSVHLRDATFLAKTTSYRLHRDRNEALRQEPAKQANSNKTDYFRIKQRNLSVARLEGREEAVGNERCGNCSGTGKCDCTYCGGIGRANYTDTNVLPAGQYPVWCKVST